MNPDTLLNVKAKLNDKIVTVSDLSPELQADYLIQNHFKEFISPSFQLWRLENLYHITTKNGTRQLFKLNKAQRHFFLNYLNVMDGNRRYRRIIILKARQLGFTTLIAIFFLDSIMWNPNTEALQVAHTLKDAGELFDRKISFAVKNLYPCVMQQLNISQNSAKKLQFLYEDGNGVSKSAIAVSNSGRSGTYNFLHISELGKLSKLYKGRADEVVTGTLPSVPASGTAIIESTAEGQSGLFYEMYTKAMDRKSQITPLTSKAEFYPVFYNWTWDEDEIKSANIDGIIPVSAMKPCEIDWAEYQKDNDLTDEQISFYYLKYIAANEDIDKLHQEYPTTEMEAFIGSGSNFFSLRRIAEQVAKLTEDYKTYDYINGSFIEAVIPMSDSFEGLVEYEEPKLGRNYIIGGDVAEGLLNGDYSVAVVLGYDKEIKAIYRGHIEPDQFSILLQALGKKYNNAMLAVEFNKDGNWVNTDLRNSGYPNLYQREDIDKITKKVNKSYGWLTTSLTRPFMLGEAKKHFNSTTINCKLLLNEMMTFIRNARGRPEAADKKHDDIIMAWSIAVGILQGKTETVKQEEKFNFMKKLYH